MNETEFITLLKERFPEAGLGDDCAIVTPPEGDMLLASDAVVEGVHFLREFSTPGQAVQKAVTSNVSDIYSMGGEPQFILLSAGIPGGAGEDAIRGVVEGLSKACGYYGLILAGGDTVKSPGGWFFDISITGGVRTGSAIRRSGASPGDVIALSGPCGGSLGGLLILEASTGNRESAGRLGFVAGDAAALPEKIGEISSVFDIFTTKQDIDTVCEANGLDPAASYLLEMIKHHIVPAAVPLSGDSALEGVSSMIDVSDGIARDLATLCGASGVGAEVDVAKVPVHGGLEVLEAFGADLSRVDIDDIIFSSGEEYRMLFTIGDDLVDGLEGKAFVIGEVKQRRDGLSARNREAAKCELPGRGFEHGF